MKKVVVLLILVALPSCDRSDAANPMKGGSSPAPEFAEINLLEFGNFDYVERQELPERIRKWHGKKVQAVGFMNPGRQIRDVKEFELVMDRNSCCFGTRPRMNHFSQVVLKDSTTVYTSDPITIVGRFEIEEQWDGDWQLGLYWIRDAKVVK